ncbi:hypothetical protein Tco_0588086 [Tanacetum coccineum]
MSTYLKNMAGYKHTQLKNKSFEEIQMGKTSKESGLKRARDELEQESSERQKVDDDDKEREDLKQCFEIVPNEEFVVHDIPLAVKPAPIVGFQIHRAGRQGSYEIIRANGSTKTYTLFSQLIKEFDREDLENLWKLIKTKHGIQGLRKHMKGLFYGFSGVIVGNKRFLTVYYCWSSTTAGWSLQLLLKFMKKSSKSLLLLM